VVQKPRPFFMIGIYKIISPSGKIYIGQTTNFTKRKNYYKNGAKPYQVRIYNSLEKYGYDAHTIEFIEECLIENLNERERYWQDFYDVIGKNGLNCRLTETKDKSGFISEESKIKMSEARKNRIFDQNWIDKLRKSALGKKHSEETKKRISESNKGRKFTTEHISKLPQNQKGKFRPKASESTKLKQSLNSGKSKIVYQYTMNRIFIEEYRNVAEAQRCLGIKNISSAALGKIPSSGGFKWSYTKF
jgi:group I intron endonuclease